MLLFVKNDFVATLRAWVRVKSVCLSWQRMGLLLSGYLLCLSALTNVWASNELVASSVPSPQITYSDYFEAIPPFPPIPSLLGGTDTIPGQVEIIEFFYYGCPDCQALRSPLADWVRSKGTSVRIYHLPALGTKQWGLMAQVFFVLKQMGHIPRLEHRIYQAMIQDKTDLTDPKIMVDWLSQQGVDIEGFLQEWNSEASSEKMQLMQALVAQYKVRSTPTFVIGGQYYWTPPRSVPPEHIFPYLDELLKKVQEKKAPSPSSGLPLSR